MMQTPATAIEIARISEEMEPRLVSAVAIFCVGIVMLTILLCVLVFVRDIRPVQTFAVSHRGTVVPLAQTNPQIRPADKASKGGKS